MTHVVLFLCVSELEDCSEKVGLGLFRPWYTEKAGKSSLSRYASKHEQCHHCFSITIVLIVDLGVGSKENGGKGI